MLRKSRSEQIAEAKNLLPPSDNLYNRLVGKGYDSLGSKGNYGARGMAELWGLIQIKDRMVHVEIYFHDIDKLKLEKYQARWVRQCELCGIEVVHVLSHENLTDKINELRDSK